MEKAVGKKTTSDPYTRQLQNILIALKLSVELRFNIIKALAT